MTCLHGAAAAEVEEKYGDPYHGGQAGDTGEDVAGGDAGVRDEKQGGVFLTPRDDGLDLTLSWWTHLDVSWGKGR